MIWAALRCIGDFGIMFGGLGLCLAALGLYWAALGRAATGRSWLPGRSWLLLVAPGCSQLLSAAPKSLDATSDRIQRQMFLNGPGLSWLLLALAMAWTMANANVKTMAMTKALAMGHGHGMARSTAKAMAMAIV